MNSNATVHASSEPGISQGMDAHVLQGIRRLAARYYSHGMYFDSACLLEYLLRHQPDRAELHFEYGKAMHAQSRHLEALKSYKRSVVLGLAELEVRLYMGQCCIFLHRHRQAAEELRLFLSLGRSENSKRSMHLLVRATHLLNDLVIPHLSDSEVIEQ